MKRALKRGIWFALFYSGLLGWLRRREQEKRARGRLLILMYHRVSDPVGDFKTLCVSPQAFEAQLRFLKQTYKVVSLDAAVEHLQSGQRLESDTLVITFDDGYRDNYLHAYPILKKYGIPATVFLTTGHIGNDRAFWWDRVARLAGTAAGGAAPVNLEAALYPKALRLPLQHLLACSPEDRGSRIDQATAAFKLLPEAKKNEVLDDLERQLQGRLAGAHPAALNWEEIREMAAGPIGFGSHTVTHPILTRVSLEQAEAEVRESKQEIERRLGKPVLHFAYPNGMAGDYNADIQALLQQCRYQSACLAGGGVTEIGTPGFALKRKYVGEFSVPELAFELFRAFRSAGA